MRSTTVEWCHRPPKTDSLPDFREIYFKRALPRDETRRRGVRRRLTTDIQFSLSAYINGEIAQL